FIAVDHGFLQDLFFDRLREREKSLTDGLYGGENGVFTDMLSKEVKTHLVDPGQRDKLLGIQIGQPGKEVRAVLDRGVNTDWPRGVYQISGNGAALDLDQMLSDH